MRHGRRSWVLNLSSFARHQVYVFLPYTISKQQQQQQQQQQPISQPTIHDNLGEMRLRWYQKTTHSLTHSLHWYKLKIALHRHNNSSSNSRRLLILFEFSTSAGIPLLFWSYKQVKNTALHCKVNQCIFTAAILRSSLYWASLARVGLGDPQKLPCALPGSACIPG